MTYAPITDPTNTFATTGLSREVRAILDCLLAAKAAGLDVVATSTTDHPRLTSSGNRSRHVMDGTDGAGLAVDCRMRQRGDRIHRQVFKLFVPVEARCHELIYADPPQGKRADGTLGPYNIRAGRRVAPYAVATHADHVHISVIQGTFLRLPPLIPPTLEEASVALNKPACAILVTPSGAGYYVVSTDGGVFNFGDAEFKGSLGDQPLNASVTDAAITPSGKGYWLLGADGGVFAFGDAGFYGSAAG